MPTISLSGSVEFNSPVIVTDYKNLVAIREKTKENGDWIWLIDKEIFDYKKALEEGVEISSLIDRTSGFEGLICCFELEDEKKVKFNRRQFTYLGKCLKFDYDKYNSGIQEFVSDMLKSGFWLTNNKTMEMHLNGDLDVNF